jgi:hypothetical protein
MPIEVMWDTDDRTAVRMVYGSQWNVQDFEAAYLETRRLMDTVPHQVDIITDVSGTSLFPSDGLLGVIRVVQKAPKTAPNTGNVVIVGASPMLKAMSSVQTRVLKGVREHYVATMEEARQYIAEQRAVQKQRAAS